VCGFEAFINGKHIVGEVKEKEQAHKEYREAISKGHGAYLMDEETPVRWSIRKPFRMEKEIRCIRVSGYPQVFLVQGWRKQGGGGGLGGL